MLKILIASCGIVLAFASPAAAKEELSASYFTSLRAVLGPILDWLDSADQQNSIERAAEVDPGEGTAQPKGEGDEVAPMIVVNG